MTLTKAELADLLFANPDCDVVYSDEDCISAKTNERHGLRLKPDWSPDLPCRTGRTRLKRLPVPRRLP